MHWWWAKRQIIKYKNEKKHLIFLFHLRISYTLTFLCVILLFIIFFLILLKLSFFWPKSTSANKLAIEFFRIGLHLVGSCSSARQLRSRAPCVVGQRKAWAGERQLTWAYLFRLNDHQNDLSACTWWPRWRGIVAKGKALKEAHCSGVTSSHYLIVLIVCVFHSFQQHTRRYDLPKKWKREGFQLASSLGAELSNQQTEVVFFKYLIFFILFILFVFFLFESL